MRLPTTLKYLPSLFAVFSVLAAGLSPLETMGQSAEPATAAEPRITLFAVEITVGPNWDSSLAPNEQAHFKDHSATLKRLRDDGHIVMGARYSDKGLIIFSAASAEDVRALMDQDPSMQAGTFNYEVHAFNVFYPGTVNGK